MILFNNKEIPVGGKPIFIREWLNNNILFTQDLLNSNGQFMTYQEFKNKFACKTNFLQFYQVVSAIPKHLVTKTKNTVPPERELYIENCPFFQLDDLTAIHLGKAKTKDFYCLLKDVRAHCYCASLVCTLYMTWRVPRHVFQARAPSRNSIKYRADDLCGNLICEYFCWMLGDPHFFFGRSLPFLILSIILKTKKYLYVGSFSYFSHTIQIGSNWYMDTGVRDLEVAFLSLILPE